MSGRVVRLEIENFKSYRGFHNIGPFKGFTAVIGPNGSGKSNLMDAISFVLGVKTAQLRGSLKELLFSNSAGTDAMDRPRRGLVKLVYENATGTETHFTRLIAPSSNSANATFQSQYKLNSKSVTWEEYNRQLKEFNILVKARNFLVFQVIAGLTVAWLICCTCCMKAFRFKMPSRVTLSHMLPCPQKSSLIALSTFLGLRCTASSTMSWNNRSSKLRSRPASCSARGRV